MATLNVRLTRSLTSRVKAFPFYFFLFRASSLASSYTLCVCVCVPGLTGNGRVPLSLEYLPTRVLGRT